MNNLNGSSNKIENRVEIVKSHVEYEELNEMQEEVLKPGPRYIYIVHLINTPYYKIGIADSVDRRLRNLQTANPFELKLIYSKSFIDFFLIENYIHNFYIKKNVRGEWFELLSEEIYEIMYFLKRLESSNEINVEIKKRLRLQKKHKERIMANDSHNNKKIRKNDFTSYTEPKICISSKTGNYHVFFRIKNPETKERKQIMIKGGINREKDIEVRKVKAEKLREKIIRLLESGITPFNNKEEFKNLYKEF